MKPTITAHVSVNGVIQGLGGADRGPRGGFERGGWALPFFGGVVESAPVGGWRHKPGGQPVRPDLFMI
jgi:hypothetical protein